MEKVKNLVAAGASIPTAIKEALGKELQTFADEYDVSRTQVSNVINGAARPSDRIIEALVKELGGSETEWRELLWLAGRPTSTAA